MTDSSTFRQKRPHAFITEDLTPLWQFISYKLRHDKARTSKTWTMDGKIKCLKAGHQEHDKPVTIDSPYDLKEVGWSDTEIKAFIHENLLKKE